MITMDRVAFSRASIVAPLPSVDAETVSRTLGLLQADEAFARTNGGEFVRACVEAVRKHADPDYPLIVDSKVHMLKPGWFPGIPGWHVDFAPGYEDVVNWAAVDENEMHFMAISSDISRTEFVESPFSLDVPRVPRVNGFLSKAVELYRPALSFMRVCERTLYAFDQRALHRVTPAQWDGWRLFVRISATKLRTARNHIRTQASQTYILHDEKDNGW